MDNDGNQNQLPLRCAEVEPDIVQVDDSDERSDVEVGPGHRGEMEVGADREHLEADVAVVHQPGFVGVEGEHAVEIG